MTPDDPRLTASALDALPADERKAVETELWSDPELLRELEETAAFAAKLKRAFSIELNAALTDDHWREIQAEAAIVGLSPERVVPMPVRRSLPAWAVPAAAGVMLGAVVTSVALTWHDAPRPLVKAVPAPAPAAVANRGTSPVASSPVVGADLKVPVVAAVRSLQDIPRGAGVAASFHPAASDHSRRNAVLPTAPSASAEPEPVQPAAVSQAVFFRNAPPELSGIAGVAPASGSAPEPVLQPAAFRSEQSTSAVSPAPMLASASALPSLPPLLFVPSAGQSTEVAGSPPGPVSLTPVQPGDGLAGTGGGGMKPVTPGDATAVAKPPTVEPSKGDEIAWRRPAFSDAMSATAGGRAPSTAGSEGDAELERMTLDLGMYPTLEHLSTVLEHDPAPHQNCGSAAAKKEGPKDPAIPLVEQFCFRHAPDVKVLVILDNGGLPLDVTPYDTPILDISAPFVTAR